jgi:hypothetical protein
VVITLWVPPARLLEDVLSKMLVRRRSRQVVITISVLLLVALCTLLGFRGSADLRRVFGALKPHSVRKTSTNGKWKATSLTTVDNGDLSGNSSAVNGTGMLDDDDEYDDDGYYDDDTEYGYAYKGNDDYDGGLQHGPGRSDYRELFSLTTIDRKYIPIYFSGDEGYNPNIIPHPTKHDMWIVVAQHEQSKEEIKVSGELVCVAGFLNGVLVCAEAPTILPIEPSIQGVCEGDLALYNFRSGPRDARMFYGPEAPYIMYGSQSQHVCLGIWVQDVRMLLDAFHLERFAVAKLFTGATEVHKPQPWQNIEKNFFFFWDLEGKAFVHHDLYPTRTFAQLDYDGKVGKNLALETASKDQQCMAQHMPNINPEWESVHQATNTLSITMCNRGRCTPDANNTFVMHIFHHKVSTPHPVTSCKPRDHVG